MTTCGHSNVSSGGAAHEATPVMPPGYVTYVVAKAAMERFSTGLAPDSRRRGIAINALRPGAVKAELATLELGRTTTGARVDPDRGRPTAVLFLAEQRAPGFTGRVVNSRTSGAAGPDRRQLPWLRVTGLTVSAGALFAGVAVEAAGSGGGRRLRPEPLRGRCGRGGDRRRGRLVGLRQAERGQDEKNDVTLSPASTIRLTLKWCLRRRPAGRAGPRRWCRSGHRFFRGRSPRRRRRCLFFFFFFFFGRCSPRLADRVAR